MALSSLWLELIVIPIFSWAAPDPPRTNLADKRKAGLPLLGTGFSGVMEV
jgi:hypothetical protein